MNDQPKCFQQIPPSEIGIDIINATLSIESNSLNPKTSKIKSWLSNINKSRLAILCVLSCSFGALLLMLSSINATDINSKYKNLVGFGNVESTNTGEKINFLRIFGLIFLSPLLIIFFRIYLFVLRPLYKKLAPPDPRVDLEL